MLAWSWFNNARTKGESEQVDGTARREKEKGYDDEQERKTER